MKKVFFLLCMLILCLSSHAQTATNADGTLKLRGNVAIMVTSHHFTKDKGQFKQLLEDDLIKELKASLQAMAMQRFGNAGFGIVNRDNEAYANVRKVLEEQKLEDYIDGFSVQAKGEGADCLFLGDITEYSEDNIVQTFLSIRLINIANNMGFHYSMKTQPTNMNDQDGMALQIKKMVQEYGKFFDKHILEVFPEQYGIAKAEGKKLYLATYQPNGRILESDKFYAFKYSQESLKLGNDSEPVQVLRQVAVATDASNAGGYCLVKSDKAVQPSADIVLFKNTDEPNVSKPMTITYFALNYQANTHEGFIKNRVNNAVYDALTRHPGSVVIEQEHLPDLKKERELQKTEDFIDGHVVDQMKAIGAGYMLHLENFKINGGQVSFKLNMVSIAQNRILRTVDVITSIDNIEDEMYKQICERLSYPCNVTQIDKKNIVVTTGWSLSNGTKFVIEANKPIQNPITGEISYTLATICTGRVNNYMGNKFEADIESIESKEDFSIISQYSEVGALSINLDGSDIKSDTSTKTGVEKKKKGSFGKGLLNALKESVTINVK